MKVEPKNLLMGLTNHCTNNQHSKKAYKGTLSQHRPLRVTTILGEFTILGLEFIFAHLGPSHKIQHWLELCRIGWRQMAEP